MIVCLEIQEISDKLTVVRKFQQINENSESFRGILLVKTV